MLEFIKNVKLITNVLSLIAEIKAIFADNSGEINETKEIIKSIIDGFKALGEKIEPAKAIYSAIKGKLK